MPWKLISLLLFIILIIVFAGLNIDGVTINLGIITFPNIPLFLCFFFSFIAGVLVGIPVTYFEVKRKARRKMQRPAELEEDENNEENEKAKPVIDEGTDEEGVYKPKKRGKKKS